MSELFENSKPKKDRPRMDTAGQVMDALRLRYPSNQYALIAEVGNSTGFRCNRHADAIAVGLWPSRGIEIIGVEIKVRRSDWQKELADPGKADIIAQYCDRWFLAVGDSEIVKEGELPPNWGLLVPKSDKELKFAKEAPLLPDIKALDRGFVAAILRKACEQITPEAELKRQFERGKEEGVKQQQERGALDLKYAKEDYMRLKETVSVFEKASGVRIADGWHTEQIGEAVALLKHGTYLKEVESLKQLKYQCEAIASRIGFAIGKLAPTPAQPPADMEMAGQGPATN